MAFAKVYGAQPGLNRSHIIEVETDLTKGLHQFTVVGLPDKAVEESRDRFSAAIKNSGWKPPKQHNRKITVSLAPADVRKEGPAFDLPMALSYLLATESVVFDPEGKIFLGELALDGTVRRVRGILSATLTAKEAGYTEIFVPKENADEAALVSNIRVYPVNSLQGVVAHLEGKTPIKPMPHRSIASAEESRTDGAWNDIRGQRAAKRALEIAAAGGHNIGLWGPPGTGKTLLARALTSILPPLSDDEVLEVTAIHSFSGTLERPQTVPPFRSPHHTASYVSIIGGGTTPRPGEATLAHRGVLFLDEFPEFDKRVIESLRQPLEEGVIHVSRAKGSERFPARFLLVAAMNPCPCGYWGDRERECVCLPGAINRYQRKISGPIVDRIDMWIEVPRIDHAVLAPGTKDAEAESAAIVRERVARSRAIQYERFRSIESSATINAHMGLKEINHLLRLSPATEKFFTESAKRLDLSARAYHRTLKLARTIADLAEEKEIGEAHLLEALQFRPKRLFA
jgi:magnesium chelatase family protein